MSTPDPVQEIRRAFARLDMLEEAYRRAFPDGRLGPPREKEPEPRGRRA